MVKTRKKGNLSDFEGVVAVDARWTSVSRSEIADLLGFSYTSISRFLQNMV